MGLASFLESNSEIFTLVFTGLLSVAALLQYFVLKAQQKTTESLRKLEEERETASLVVRRVRFGFTGFGGLLEIEVANAGAGASIIANATWTGQSADAIRLVELRSKNLTPRDAARDPLWPMLEAALGSAVQASTGHVIRPGESQRRYFRGDGPDEDATSWANRNPREGDILEFCPIRGDPIRIELVERTEIHAVERMGSLVTKQKPPGAILEHTQGAEWTFRRIIEQESGPAR